MPTKKNKLFFVGYSTIKNTTGTGHLSDHTVKIRSRPELRHQHDFIIFHCETKDIQDAINTLKKLKRLRIQIEGYDTQNKPQVVISSLIEMYDQDFKEDFKNINKNHI